MRKIIFNIFIVITLISCSAKNDDPGVEYAPNMYHSVPYEPLSQVKDEEIGSWLDSNLMMAMVSSTTLIHIIHMI